MNRFEFKLYTVGYIGYVQHEYALIGVLAVGIDIGFASSSTHNTRVYRVEFSIFFFFASLLFWFFFFHFLFLFYSHLLWYVCFTHLTYTRRNFVLIQYTFCFQLTILMS